MPATPIAIQLPQRSNFDKKEIAVYLALKHIHLTFVALSLLTFFVRGIWLFMNSSMLSKTLVKMLPHVINTILLVSGVVLAVHLRMSPGDQPWLMAKIVGLIAYIGLGVAAFKVPNPNARKLLWVSALIVFAYIVSVAVGKNPLGFFS
jgi:uncharacterized membrane protein SirB2